MHTTAQNTAIKPPFTRKAGLSYNIPCGAANGRCVGGSGTCAGFQVLAHLETAAFLFFKSIIAGNAFQCKRESDVPRPTCGRLFRKKEPVANENDLYYNKSAVERPYFF